MTTEDDRKRHEQTEAAPESDASGADAAEQSSGDQAEERRQDTEAAPPTESSESTEATDSLRAGGDTAAAGPPGGGTEERPRDGEEPPAGGRPAAVAALVIALLVAVGVGLGGYELWQGLRELRGAQQGMASREALQQRSAALGQRIEALAGGQKGLNERLTGLDDSLNRVVGRLDQRAQQAGALADQIETLRQQYRSLEGRVDEAITMASSEGDDWRRAEAGYLASVAVYRVRFHGDADGALRALRTADELLAGADAPPVALRQALSAAIDRLVKVNLPDREDLASRIEDLEAGIGQWPLRSGVDSVAGRSQGAAPETADPAQAPGWRQALERAWGQLKASLGRLVVVQRDGESLPLVSPAERFFLEQNLRLRLESARLALVAGDEPLYRRSLERVQSWLERYFDAGVPAVRDAVSEVSALAAASITAQLPDLGSTLQPLTRLD